MVAMMVGMLGIMAALVWKLTQSPPSRLGTAITGEIEIPRGFEVLNVSRSDSSLFLILENSETGQRLLQERNAEQQHLIGQYLLQEVEK